MFFKQTRGCKRLHIFLATWLLPLFVTGCSLPRQEEGSHGHSHGEDIGEPGQDAHDHAHEEERESMTLWSASLELYAEYPLLVSGESQEFLLHLTRVDTGLPVDAPEVAFRAKPQEGDKTAEGAATFVKPGIYTISIEFPSPGEWSVDLSVPFETGTTLIGMTGLDVHAPGEAHEHDHDEGVESANTVTFTKEQQWVIPLITLPVIAGDLVERHKLPATVRETPDSHNILTAPLGGRLVPPDSGSFPVLGDRVEAGQVMAGIAPTLLGSESLAWESNMNNLLGQHTELAVQAVKAKGEAERARALVAQHAAALERAERLLAAKAGSRRDVDEQQSALAGARALLAEAQQTEAQVRAALAELPRPEPGKDGQSTAWIKAPIAGWVTRADSGPGAHVDAGQTVFEVDNTERVLIEGQVPEVIAPALSQPITGWYEVPAFPSVLNEIIAPPGARDPWMLPSVNPDTRTVPLLFHAMNPDGRLRIGMTLTLFVGGRRVEGVLQAPLSAVVDENGVPTVYVMLSGERFQKRPVRLGVTDGAMTEVLDGVSAGERLVTRGAYAVRLAGLGGSGLGSAHVH